MFHAKFPRRILCLVCAAVLMLTLASCKKSKRQDEAPASVPEPTPTPSAPAPEPVKEASLEEIFDDTAAELNERFGASPISRLASFLANRSLTADFTGELSESAIAFSGTLTADRPTGMAEATLTLTDTALEARLHYDSEFMGLICKTVFGDGRWYGLKPYNLTEQLDGSGLATILSLDMDAVAQLDGVLDSIPKDAYTYSQPLTKQLTSLTRELITGHKWEKDEIGGKGEAKAANYTAQIPASKLGGTLHTIASSGADLKLLYGLISGVKSQDIDSAIAAFESSGQTVPVTFTVSGGRVRHIAAKCAVSGQDVSLDVELYSEDGESLYITLDPVFEIEVRAGDDVHLAMFTHTGDGSTTTFDWSAGGEMSFITYSTDITNLALEGTLTVSEDSLNYDGVWYSGNRGDRNMLTLACRPGGEVTAPEDTVSLAELSERQIFLIVTRAVMKAL